MIELGLKRISHLLAETPLPWRAIHVAGTNGKGSICAYISAMLDVYNRSDYRQLTRKPVLKHARFTSPHLVDRWDCITIDQRAVSFSTFDRVEHAVLARNEHEDLGASEFELLTATAFELFTKEKVDVAVVEVGMGGRLDATNILGEAMDVSAPDKRDIRTFRPPPLVTAISKIGLDHQGFLGNTLLEIAAQKAGILKHNVPLVFDRSNDPEVCKFLIQQAGDRIPASTESAILTEAPSPTLPSTLVNRSLPEERVSQTLDYSGLPQHTKSNAAVALHSTWAALQGLGCVPRFVSSTPADESRSLAALASRMKGVPLEVSFPGRLQQISIESLTGHPTFILLDGAHNAQSAQVLATYVNEKIRTPAASRDHKAVTWVLAASDTKDLTDILQPLLQQHDRVFAVEFGPVDGMPWVNPMSAEQIVQAAHSIIPKPGDIECHACGKGVLSALRQASVQAAGAPVVVAGSLYLVGDVLRLLREHTPHC